MNAAEKKLTGWIIANGCLKTKTFVDMLTFYEETAKDMGINLIRIWNNEIAVEICDGEVYFKDSTLKKPDFVLFLDKDIYLARNLERLGIRVFNSADTIEICDDKAKTFQALLGHHIAMPTTFIAPLVYKGKTEEVETYINQIEEQLGYPLVVKENFGSYGQQVYLVHDRAQLIKKRYELLDKPHLYQAFVKSSRGRDVRLYVVGNEVIASMLRVSESDFRANISIGGKAISYEAPESFKALAVKVCQILKADFAGVDLMFGEKGEPILCEVNSNAHIKGIQSCTGVNIARRILLYIADSIDR